MTTIGMRRSLTQGRYIMAMADEADCQLVSSWMTLSSASRNLPKRPSPASRSIRRASYWSWLASKAPRVSSNKLNPFNTFQQEMKRDQNLELRTGRPAPGTAGINKGRPGFTGAYQKDLAEKCVQAPSRAPNLRHRTRLRKGSDLKAHRKLIKKAHAFSGELSSHGAHHIIMIVPHSALPRVQNCLVLFGRVWPGVCQVDGNRRVVDHALRNHVSRRRSIGGGPAEAGAT
jgi:hypothetical protein